MTSKFRNILFAEKGITLAEIQIKEGGTSKVRMIICFFKPFVLIFLLEERNKQILMFCSKINNLNSRNILN